MEITLKRKYFNKEYTIGELYINEQYICNTLEDTYRDLSKEAKISNKTCIPYGRYKVIVNYSPKFKRTLPRLLNVPYFEGILIHRGNTPNDTSGCILPGENTQKGKVLNSTKYELLIIDKINEATKNNEETFINIV